jgi:hypothetical protein
MTTTLILNAILMASALTGMVSLLGWAIRTAGRDHTSFAARSTTQPERRLASRPMPTYLERHRSGYPVASARS